MEATTASLANYRQLVEKVEAFSRKVTLQYRDHIACKPGCDACCLHLTVFPVEAASIAATLKEVAPERRRKLQEIARNSAPEGPCPLLVEGCCALYEARPLVCRTHGLPLLVQKEGGTQVDHCPRNFRGVPSLSGDAVLDLERLNELLVAVDARFREECGSKDGKRVTVAEALLFEPYGLEQAP